MPDSIAFTLGPLTVRWYGLLISSAMALAVFLCYRECQKQHLDPDMMLTLALIIVPAAIIGARLYYVLFSWDYYSVHLADIPKIWHGGLAIHGGLIGAVIASSIYLKYKKMHFLQWSDLILPTVILGQAIGRWGNFFNQEAYGYETTVPWAMYIAGAYRHPTFLYESLWDIGVFILLLCMLKKPHRYGKVTAYYCIAYSLGRGMIETFRTDSLMFGPVRVAVLISIIGIVIGIALLCYIRKNPVVDVYALPGTKVKSQKK